MAIDVVDTYKQVLSAKSVDDSNPPTMPLADLRIMASVLVYGVVSEIKKAPTKTKGQDYSMSFYIVDPTLPSSRFITINMFYPIISAFPSLKRGDIVSCRIKVQMFAERFQGLILSSKRTGDCSVGISVLTEGNQEMDQVDQRIMACLRSWWNEIHTSLPSRNNSPIGQNNIINQYSPMNNVTHQPVGYPETPSGRPTLNLSEIKPRAYFDFFGKVVHIPETVNSREDIYILGITDFTINPKLKPYISEGDLPAYIPKHSVLTCTFWDEHVEKASQLRVGDIVAIKNLHCKSGFDDGYLEASLHTDRRFRGNKITILKQDSSHPKVLSLVRREKALRHANYPPVFIQEGPGGSATRSGSPTRGAPVPITAASMPITTLEEILKNENVPNKYKVSVQIVDVLPKSIYEFSRLCCNECLESLGERSGSGSSQECSKCGVMGEGEYQWLFSFLVTDGTGFLPVILSYDDATGFLNGLEAVPLLKGAEETQTLIDYMSHIWGVPTLEIHPETGAFVPGSSRQFECLIASYYITNDDGEKATRYKLFNSRVGLN